MREGRTMSKENVQDFAVKTFGFEADVTIEVFAAFERGADANEVWQYVQDYINSNPAEFGLE